MTTQADDKQNEPKANAEAESNTSSKASQEAGKELIDELTTLGYKFVEVVEVAWNSEQRKKIEEDLRSGLVTVASSLEDGFKRVSSSKEAQEAVNAAEDVADKVRSSKIAVELSGALADGLRALSEQLDKLSTELKKSSSSASTETKSAAKNSQDIPISRDEQP
jgi:hypothetical protein